MSRRPVVVASVVALLSHALPGAAQDHTHGTVSFRNSCTAAVQPSLQKAVAMLHSFGPEAEPAFREVLTQDPTCAIATWGIASILMGNPLNGAGSLPQWAAAANAALDRGRQIGAGTQRERDYIDAVGAYYDGWANHPEAARQAARARAYQALAVRYPDDDEAQIFSALYMAGTQSLADQSYQRYLAAAKILEAQFVKHPDHPGVAHYLIHVYDAPPLAAQGLPAAKLYAGIAPAAAHALHMPSHIFTRVGAWTESAATNARSAAAAAVGPDASERLHAMDYMVYAYLQLARDEDARRGVDEASRLTSYTRAVPAGPYARAAMPARYALERGDWAQAAALEPQPDGLPFTAALRHFARALGAARSGNPSAAGQDLEELARLRDATKTPNPYWSNEIEISRLGAAAWVAWADGRHDEALVTMRAAADAEDKSEKHIVTPGRLLPARELLGEMLLAAKRPADALKEFELSQQREPDRFRGLFDAAQAAEQSGDRVKAQNYYARLIEIAGSGSARPELELARRLR